MKIIKRIIPIILVTLLFGCSKEETLVRTQIEIAGFEENSLLSEYILTFNESQNEYEVVYTLFDYSEDSQTKLMIDMVGGRGPDLVSWGKFYDKTLTSSDVFLDLRAYVDSKIYTTSTQDTYAYNIINSFRTSDELKVLVANYKISCMALLSENLVEIDTWNIDSLIEYYNQRDDNMVLFMGETKQDVLAYMLGASLDSFIDWETQSTAFDSESFQKLLVFCNEFPNSLEFDDSISIRNMYQQGNILMYPLIMSSVFDVTTTNAIFGDNSIDFMGYPTESGSALVCAPLDQAFSVNSQCENLDGVYQVLDGILSSEYQSNLSTGYPVLNIVLEEQLEEASSISYDPEGNPIVKAQVLFEGETPEYIYQITPADGVDLKKLINNVSSSSFTNLELIHIIFEESDAYFQGDKTVEDVMNTIKNRADLYIKEQY